MIFGHIWPTYTVFIDRYEPTDEDDAINNDHHGETVLTGLHDAEIIKNEMFGYECYISLSRATSYMFWQFYTNVSQIRDANLITQKQVSNALFKADTYPITV